MICPHLFFSFHIENFIKRFSCFCKLIWCSFNADHTFPNYLACLPLEFPLNGCSFPPTPLTDLITITSSQSSSLLSDVKATGQPPWWEGCSSSPHGTARWVRVHALMRVCLCVSAWGQTDTGVSTSCLCWPVTAHTNQVAHTYAGHTDTHNEMPLARLLFLTRPLSSLVFDLFSLCMEK